MAGDWIKMRSNLWTDPRVARLCDRTGCTEAQIIGGLYWLWSTADQHTEDGLMPGLSIKQVDRKTGIKGFGAALCEINWLSESADGVRIERFKEHNGASAKRRATDAQRKSKSRETSASHADKKRTESGEDDDEKRGFAELEKEKEKEKREIPPKGPPLVLPEWLPLPQWEAFVAMRKAKGSRAPFTDAAKAGILRELDKLRTDGNDPAQVLDASVINGWSGVFPVKTKPQKADNPFAGAM